MFHPTERPLGMSTVTNRIAVVVATVALVFTGFVAATDARASSPPAANASQSAEVSTLQAQIDALTAAIARTQREWDAAFVSAAASQM
jgi:hypothetical protein